MYEILICAIIGAVLGTLTTLAVTFDTIKLANSARTVITECEKTIPRDRNCKLIAVIIEENNHD